MASDKSYATEQRLAALIASHQTVTASGPLTLSASFQTVPGLSVDLVAGEYHVRAQIMLNPSVSGGFPAYQYSGSGGLAFSHGRLVITELFPVGTITMDWGADAALPFALTSGSSVGGGLVDRLATFDGYLNVSTPGTLNIQAKLSAGSGSMVQFGSYLEAIQLS